MSDVPTLLFCVGAAKAGTSWLHRQLRAHPDCHLRTIKELHYFDTLESGGFDRQIEIHRQRVLAVADAAVRPEVAARRRRDAAEWLGVLQKRQHDPEAYLGYLMHGLRGRRLVADMTPAYGLLPVDRLRQMVEVVPDTRFLFILRDPLARLWSHVRMLASRRAAARPSADMSVLTRAALSRVLKGDDPEAASRGDYAQSVVRLREAVPERRLLVLFQEEMMSEPGFARLCRFSGIEPRGDAQFDARVNEGSWLDLPDPLRARALAYLAPQYDFVAREFGPLPAGWSSIGGQAA